MKDRFSASDLSSGLELDLDLALSMAQCWTWSLLVSGWVSRDLSDCVSRPSHARQGWLMIEPLSESELLRRVLGVTLDVTLLLLYLKCDPSLTILDILESASYFIIINSQEMKMYLVDLLLDYLRLIGNCLYFSYLMTLSTSTASGSRLVLMWLWLVARFSSAPPTGVMRDDLPRAGGS